MSQPTLQTSWMWTYNGEIRGLHIDTEGGRLLWYDNVECLCADDGSLAEQTIAEYGQQAVPGIVGDVPADVLAELAVTVAALQGRQT